MKLPRILLFALVLFLPLPAQTAQILILHSGAAHFATELARGLRAADSAAEVEIEDLAGSAAYRPQLEALWRVKYAELDALVAADAASLAYLKERRAALFGAVPVVALAYAPLPAAAPGYHYIRLEPDLRASLSLIKRLQPAVRQVKLVLGPLSPAQLSASQAVFVQFAPGLNCEIWPVTVDIEVALKHSGPDTALLYGLNSCGTGDDLHNFKRLAKGLNVPVYGLWDTYLGAGLVGGSVLSAREIGQTLAGSLAAILNGQPPLLQAPAPRMIFDGAALERHGLDAGTLPDGARVLKKAWAGPWLLWLLLCALAAWLLTAVWVGLLLASRRRYRGDLARLGGELDFVRGEHSNNLRLIEELKILLQQSGAELVVLADGHGRILLCNAGFARAWAELAPGANLADAVDGSVWPAIMSAVQTGGHWSGALRLRSGLECSASLRRIFGGLSICLVLEATPRVQAPD